MKLRLLWTIAVEHGFWAPDPLPGLQLVPGPGLTRWLRSHRLHLHARPGCFEAWAELDAGGKFRLPPTNPGEHTCTFSLTTTDQRIWKATAEAATGSGLLVPNYGHAPKKYELKRIDHPGGPTRPQFAGEFARVTLQLPGNLGKRKQAPRYLLKLDAVRDHWTYVLITRNPEAEYSIADKGQRFGPCAPLSPDNFPPLAAALQQQFPSASGYFLYQIRSNKKMPLRSRPPNGLSLHSSDGLLKAHLPAPGPADDFIRTIHLIPNTTRSFHSSKFQNA